MLISFKDKNLTNLVIEFNWSRWNEWTQIYSIGWFKDNDWPNGNIGYRSMNWSEQGVRTWSGFCRGVHWAQPSKINVSREKNRIMGINISCNFKKSRTFTFCQVFSNLIKHNWIWSLKNIKMFKIRKKAQTFWIFSYSCRLSWIPSWWNIFRRIHLLFGFEGEGVAKDTRQPFTWVNRALGSSSANYFIKINKILILRNICEWLHKKWYDFIINKLIFHFLWKSY